MFRTFMLILLAALPVAQSAAADSAASRTFLDHELRRLHSDEKANLRARYAGQALLIVNTASYCGFTPQFKKLEALHREYKDRGLTVIGFPSNDFRQEAADENKTAEVCYQNFGVSFDMYQPIKVRGKDAHPIFQELARQTAAPEWNFYKYVVDRRGQVVGRFASTVEPDAAELRGAIDRALQSKP